MAKEFVSAKSTEIQNVVSDLTRFLLKKDFLFSRFSNFNDQPETFATWKASFKDIAEELYFTPFDFFVCLFEVYRPTREFFTHMERSLLR